MSWPWRSSCKVNDKSLSKQRGFLGLAPHSSVSAGETPPPLHHWTRDELQTMRMERVFPLCQTLDAAPCVTGAALVTVLLCDLYKRNTNIPMAALKSNHPPGRLIGAWPLETLSEDLADKDSFPVPNTFVRARTLVMQAGKDVKECIFQGFLEAKIHFFPAFKFRDFRGTKRIWWNFKDYVQVHCSACDLFPLSVVASMTLQVCVEVERRSLTYSRNLEKYRDHGMAWMEKVLTRLPPGLKKTPNMMLRVLTFVSCIGMLMNGDYVSYNQLRNLLDEMSNTFSQKDLQKLQIQLRFTLPKVFNMVIWKLHEDIPYHVVPQVRPVLKTPQRLECPEDELPEEDVQEVELQDDLRPLERSQAMYLHANSSRKWSAQEVALISTDKYISLR